MFLKYPKIDEIFVYIQGSYSNNKLTKLDIIQKHIAKLMSIWEVLMIRNTMCDTFDSEGLRIDFISVSYSFGNKDEL